MCTTTQNLDLEILGKKKTVKEVTMQHIRYSSCKDCIFVHFDTKHQLSD